MNSCLKQIHASETRFPIYLSKIPYFPHIFSPFGSCICSNKSERPSRIFQKDEVWTPERFSVKPTTRTDRKKNRQGQQQTSFRLGQFDDSKMSAIDFV